MITVKFGSSTKQDAIKAKTDLIPASPAAVGSAMTLTAAYDAAKTAAQASDIPSSNITAIKAKTDLIGASVALSQAVPAADATTNAQVTDVAGNKEDAAVLTPATNKSLMAYVKGALTSIGSWSRAFKTQWGTRWDSSGDLGTDVASILTKLGYTVLATGTLTTSSATVPADTSRTEGDNHWKGCLLMPLTGTCAFQPRRIKSFANTGGIMPLSISQPFTAVPGLVTYAILADQSSLVDYETISYAPGLIGGTDLEAATKTVDWTTLAASVGDAAKRYSTALTLPMACTVNGVAKVIGTTETRLEIKRIGTRFEFIIDSMTAGTLNYSISVDDATGVIAANVLMAGSNTTTGTKTVVQDCLVGTKETIFNLLKDNAAHTFYIFFWVDAGNAVLSSVKVWDLWGASATGYLLFGQLTHIGDTEIEVHANRVGTGTDYISIMRSLTFGNNVSLNAVNGATRTRIYSTSLIYLTSYTAVSTDTVYVTAINIVLRSDN